MRRSTRGRFGAAAVAWWLALAVGAASASAEPLAMTFTEARANVGVQLSDAALFEPPDLAPLEAQIDAGSGAITAGALTVPQFSTFITDPVDADVAVDFEIGIVTGSFIQATGTLTLEGEAGGTLTANGDECIVTTTPEILSLSTAGSSGGTSPRSGAPFGNGLSGSGAIAGQWTDMQATPVGPEDETVCETVDERIGGPGGVWLYQQGDVEPPSAPQLLGTNPASPSRVGIPQILGAAEAGSTVSVYAGPVCAGAPISGGSAAQLGSPGLTVEVAEGVTASFSATATDAAGNTSPCSAPISYTRTSRPPPPPPPALTCVVPKLVGKTLFRAKAVLKSAGCQVGKVRSRRPMYLPRRTRVVRSSNPPAGATPADGKVNLWLGPKPYKPHS